jgi:hypothetical protein
VAGQSSSDTNTKSVNTERRRRNATRPVATRLRLS